MGPQELGARGEQFVLDLLQDAGLDAEQGGPGDILVNDLVIEVKAARLSRRTDCRGKRFVFNLYRAINGRVKTDARRADLVCLLCYNGRSFDEAHGRPEPVVYAIPQARVGDRRQIALPENLTAYAGRWSWYRGWSRALKELGV